MMIFAHMQKDLLSRFLAFSVVSVCFTGSNTMTRPLFVLVIRVGSVSPSDISSTGPMELATLIAAGRIILTRI